MSNLVLQYTFEPATISGLNMNNISYGAKIIDASLSSATGIVSTTSATGTQSLYCAGTDFATIPSVPAGFLSANAMTISFWVNYSIAIATNQRLFQLDPTTPIYILATTTNYMTFYYNTASVLLTNPTANPFALGRWHHVAWVITPTTWTIYVDGVPNTATVATTIPTTLSTSYIGKGTSDDVFSGYLDDFRIYNTALSADQAYDIYDSGTEKCYYRFEPTDISGTQMANVASGRPIYDASFMNTTPETVIGYITATQTSSAISSGLTTTQNSMCMENTGTTIYTNDGASGIIKTSTFNGTSWSTPTNVYVGFTLPSATNNMDMNATCTRGICVQASANGRCYWFKPPFTSAPVLTQDTVTTRTYRCVCMSGDGNTIGAIADKLYYALWNDASQNYGAFIQANANTPNSYANAMSSDGSVYVYATGGAIYYARRIGGLGTAYNAGVLVTTVGSNPFGFRFSFDDKVVVASGANNSTYWSVYNGATYSGFTLLSNSLTTNTWPGTGVTIDLSYNVYVTINLSTTIYKITTSISYTTYGSASFTPTTAAYKNGTSSLYYNPPNSSGAVLSTATNMVSLPVINNVDPSGITVSCWFNTNDSLMRTAMRLISLKATAASPYYYLAYDSSAQSLIFGRGDAGYDGTVSTRAAPYSNSVGNTIQIHT